MVVERFKKTLIAIGAFALCVYLSFGESVLDMGYQFYTDNNDVYVHTPTTRFKQTLEGGWGYSWIQQLDGISGASRIYFAHSQGVRVDGISGASARELRLEETLGVHYDKDEGTASASVYFSKESDYLSIAPSAGLSRNFADANTTLGLKYGHYFDRFSPKTGEGGERELDFLDVSLAQSLTPLSVVAFFSTLSYDRGKLDKPYYPVTTQNGLILSESLPEEKKSSAFALRINQGFFIADRLSSIQVQYRWYRDSWRLASHTADLKGFHYLNDYLYTRLQLRFYNQSGAAFAKTKYEGREEYRTAQVRYFPFSSIMTGVKWAGVFPASWLNRSWLPERWSLESTLLLQNTEGDRRLYQLHSEDYYAQLVLRTGISYDL